MKKSLLFVPLVICSMFSYATLTSPTNNNIDEILGSSPENITEIMGDFTVIDTDGITRNLYQTLDEGNTVFVFIMSATCGTCNAWAPTIAGIHTSTGSNQEGIVVWGISAWSTNNQLVSFKNQHNAQFPFAGTTGNGINAVNTITTGQVFLGYPTLVVICPDGSFYFDVCRPPSLNCLNPYFNACAAVPQINITFQVDVSSESVSPDGIHLVVKDEDPMLTPMEDQGDGIWSVTKAFPKNTTINFVYSNGINNYEIVPQDCSTGNPLLGYWRFFDVENSHTTLDLVCFGGCGICPEHHTIILEEGWNGLSSFLVPEEGKIENVLAEIMDDLIIVQSMTGFLFPEGSINTIGNWDNHAAFQIKVDDAVQLTIVGHPETNKTVTLTAGWNLVPVLSEVPVEVSDIFGDILGSVLIVKPTAGVSIFWPDMNINTIGLMEPGNSYFVKMTASGSITFP